MKRFIAGVLTLLFSAAGLATAGGFDAKEDFYDPNGTIYAPRKFFVGSEVTPYEGFSPIKLEKGHYLIGTYLTKVVPDGNTGYWFVEFLTTVSKCRKLDSDSDYEDYEETLYTTTLYLKSGQDWVFFDVRENRYDNFLSAILGGDVYDKKEFLRKGPPFRTDDGKHEYLEYQVYNLVEGRGIRCGVRLSPNCIEFVEPGDKHCTDGLFGLDDICETNGLYENYYSYDEWY